MELTVGEKQTVAVGDFGIHAATIHSLLEGRKIWKSPQRLVFETSAHNLRVIEGLFPVTPCKPTGFSEPTPIASPAIGNPEAYPWVLLPRDFQLVNFNRFKDQNLFAIFSEQGTGKTKTAIDIICYRWTKKKITGVLVLSSPKGVHAQWIEQQWPKHVWPGTECLIDFWDGKKAPPWLGKPSEGKLQVFSGNIDMLVHDRPYDVLIDFCKVHGDGLMIIIDEADSIKNLSSKRSKQLRALADRFQKKNKQRGIMTGTPIAKDLTDEWAEFYFLDRDIIGHKYKVSFMGQFCRMGGFEGRQVIGHRNLEQFKSLTAPYIFRATKADLDLPSKVMDEVVFDMTDEQKRLIKSLKENFIALVEEGKINAANGAVALMRMQQISNGYYVDEHNQVNWLKDNPRMAALQKLRSETTGPRIIWCRFHEDIEAVCKELPGALHYYGGTSDKERAHAKNEFLAGRLEDLVASAGALGRGVDGLQEVCSLAAYYSNSFNAIERWQSEDRIHRIGMKGTASYFDLIARGSPDRTIIRNLARKKGISDLVLTDLIREVREI